MPPGCNSTPHSSTEYDRQVRRTIPYYEHFHRETIDLVQIAKPDPSCWLDTGCGTGYLVEIALNQFPRTQFVLADPSSNMLEEARQGGQSVSPLRGHDGASMVHEIGSRRTGTRGLGRHAGRPGRLHTDPVFI